MDADGSYNPLALKEMLKEINNGYDVVFGSRYLPNSGSDDDTFVRYIGNKLFTLFMQKLFKVKLTDALFLYILAKKEVFDRIDMESTHFEWCIEFPIKVHRAEIKYKEIPVKERKRIAGKSKVNAFSDGFKILYGLLKQLNPS